MKASQKICDYIMSKESFSPTVYICPAGVPTIGYGHAIYEKPNPFTGKTITKKEAGLLFNLDVIQAEKTVLRHIKAPLTQNQFDALVSFAFNLGNRGFRLGTGKDSTLKTKLNAKDYAGAAAEFDKWVYGGGKKLPGLVKRRKEEKTIFLS